MVRIPHYLYPAFQQLLQRRHQPHSATSVANAMIDLKSGFAYKTYVFVSVNRGAPFFMTLPAILKDRLSVPV
ncbi:MAG: hypothetical protein KDJ48_10130, partial [Nitratireductor sp.]|nr:hypothetical protein [Nitratireductor sp.]